MSCRQIRDRSSAGFTLVEMMVVVGIIGVSAALAMPAARDAIARQRAARVSMDLVRLARRARSESIGYGRAHLMRFTDATTGEVEVYRGITSLCNGNDWPALIAAGACGVNGSMCVDSMDLESSRYKVGSHGSELRVPAVGAFLDICFQPNGAMQWRTSAVANFNSNDTLGGGIRFRVRRKVDAAFVGVTRWVVFPVGGTPRVLR